MLKVKRAKQHINDLNGQVTEYLAAAPLELRVRQSVDPPERLVYVRANYTVPDEFSLIVGDAVHNLRTALDHLCFAMVGDKAKRPEGVGFPFAKTGGDGLSGAISTRQMHLASEQVIKELHFLEPYPGGNKYLYAVKALDERDKHHFIVTVGVGVNFSVDQMATMVGAERVSHIPRDAGYVLATVGDFIVKLDGAEAVEAFDKKADFQPPFTIGFAQGEELAGLPVMASLASMVSATEDAIWRLADGHFAR